MGLFDIFKKTSQPAEDDPMKAFVQMMEGEIARNPQACSTDSIPEGTGEFGLTVTNPIPVRTIPANEVYLRRLRLEDGSTITWTRLGSTEINEIWGNIDEYEISDESGNVIGKIYISPYHRKISNKAPKGYKLV